MTDGRVILPASASASPRVRHPGIVQALFLLALATTSLVTVRLAPAVTLTDGLLLACGVLEVLRLLAKGSRPPSGRNSPIPVAWLASVGLILLGGLMSSARATAPLESVGITIRLVAVTGVLPLLCWLLLRDEPALARAVIAFAVSGAVQGCAALLQLAGAESAILGANHYGRYTGFAGHPNDLGAALAITLPISFICLFLFARRPLIFSFFVLGSFLTSVGLALSGSLSAILGGVAGVIASFIALRGGNGLHKGSRWFGAGGLLAACLALGLFANHSSSFWNDSTFTRLKDPRTRINEVLGGEGTLATRLETVNSAFADIASNPLIGLGFDHQSTDVFDGGQVHSMPILAWQAGGLLVLLGLGGVIWLSLTIVRPRNPSGRGRLGAVQAGLLGSICAMIVNGAAQPFLYKRFGWIPVALVLTEPILAKAAGSLRRRPSSYAIRTSRQGPITDARSL